MNCPGTINLVHIFDTTSKFVHARCSYDIISSTSVSRVQLNIVRYIFIIDYNITTHFLRTFMCVSGVLSSLSGLCSLSVVPPPSWSQCERRLPIIYIIPSACRIVDDLNVSVPLLQWWAMSIYCHPMLFRHWWFRVYAAYYA